MQFNCSVCQHVHDEEKTIPLVALKAQQHRCQTCSLLWEGTTAVLGPELRDVLTDLDIPKRGPDEDGPLMIRLRYHQMWGRTIQFYRAQHSAMTWPEIGVGSDVGLTSLSEPTIERARLWLGSCTSRENSHSACERYAKTAAKLPTRVIDVSSHKEHAIKLYSCHEGEFGRYIALSHCWGKSSPSVLTTTENFEDHKKENPLPLPQTFMDAIHVTRELGVQYLWIDSLCIIQNDPDDWYGQAPQMAEIYGNAYCTISADAAENSADGFLRGLRRHHHIPHQINYQVGGEHGVVFARPYSHRYPQQPLHDFGPLSFLLRKQKEDRYRVENTIQSAQYGTLSTRAWVYQERALSPRTLHFGNSEMGWECRSLVDCECSPTSHVNEANNNITQQSLKASFERYPWNSIVEHYTRLNVTFPRDRLAALSGLAKARCEATHDPYLAGMFLSVLKGGLLWTVHRKNTAEQNVTQRLDIAPTWSWASVSGEIIYWKISGRHIPDHTTCCLDWEILGGEFKGKGKPNFFGPSVHGRLTIQGLLIEVAITNWHELENTGADTKYHIEIQREQNLQPDCRSSIKSQIYWDVKPEVHTVYTLFFTSHPDGDAQGIVLMAESPASTYSRLGMFHMGRFSRGPIDPLVSWKEYLRLVDFHMV